jgi:hypothetical protein
MVAALDRTDPEKQPFLKAGAFMQRVSELRSLDTEVLVADALPRSYA